MVTRGKPFPEYVNNRVAATVDNTTTFPVVEGVNGRQFDYDDMVATLTAALSALYALKSGTTFTGNVVVPAATAATHAAQVTAIDAATGRLAIGGREIGDTGWRKVLSWTAGVQDADDQIGVIDTAMYTISGTGSMSIRRQGGTVTVYMGNSAANSLVKVNGARVNLVAMPAGFWRFGNTASAMIANISVAGSSSNLSTGVNFETTFPAGTPLAFASTSWLTEATWPTTLPGVAGP